MEKNKLIKLLATLISIPIFWWLESGLSLRSGDELVKALIFAASLFMVMTKLKLLILKVSLCLLIVMVLLYLFWQINVATLFGSIGFGMFLIYILSYLPDFIKRGFAEDK